MRYRLGDELELDVDAVELCHGGELVPIEPQVFDVLAHLVANAQRVVTKEELLDTIWGDRFVSESALTSRIKTARRAVGDDGREQRMIRTVHGRGYRWVGSVAPASNAPDAPDAPDAHAAPALVASREPSGGGAEETWPLVGRDTELTHIEARFTEGRVGGVLITGAAGLGKTKLAEEAVRHAAGRGVPVATVRAHTEARNVPLACMAHLLPITVTDSVGPDGDLSRGRLLRNAISGVEERAGSGRLMLFVDDIDLADDLSRAVVAALAQSPATYVIVTQRVDGPETSVALEQLIGDQTIDHLELAPVRDDLLGSALHRSLGAPLEPTCLGELLRAAAGRPGVVRQLVESSIHRGRLRLEHGVWTLTGDLSPPADLAELIDDRLGDLEDEHQEAAELIALAGSLELDVATELAGEEALDALDLRGLLGVDDAEGRVEVRLAHPLYAEVLLERLRPLRARRLRSLLADALERRPDVGSVQRLRVARWRLDGGEVVRPADLLAIARLAVVHKDHDTARELVARLQHEAPSALVDQLDAELRFRQGSPGEVEQILGRLDLDELDADQRSQVVRRRTMNLLYGLMEDDLPFEILDREIAGASGPAKTALQAHALSLQVMRGDLQASLAEGEDQLAESAGEIRLEVMRSVGFALWGVGRPGAAVEMVAAANELAATLGPSLSRPGLALSQMTEIFSLIGLGRLSDARRSADRIGVAVPFGWLPMATARVSMHEGRPDRAAESMANPLAFAETLGQRFVAAWMRATLAEIERLRGNEAAAVELADSADPFIEDRGRTVDLDMMMLLAPLKADRGDAESAHADLVEVAQRSKTLGFAPGIVQSLHDAARVGDAKAAASVLDELDPPIEGRGNELQIGEVRARAAEDGPTLLAIADEYHRLGFALLSARAYRGAAELGSGSTSEMADRRCHEVMATCPDLVRL